MPKFEMEPFLGHLVAHRITHVCVAPPVIVALAKHPAVEGHDLSQLRTLFSGAAPMDAALQESCAATARLRRAPGLRDDGGESRSRTRRRRCPGMNRPGTVGQLAPNTECRIVDVVTGQDVGADAEGELWVRGPQVMKGYLRNQAATEATLTADGWLRTGDIGRVDADGYFSIVDRLKELIKYKGYQVPPAELEALLLTHPAVSDSAVIGVPDPEAGESPKAFVVLKGEVIGRGTDGLRRRTRGAVQADPERGVHRRDPEVAVGEDPPAGAEGADCDVEG